MDEGGTRTATARTSRALSLDPVLSRYLKNLASLEHFVTFLAPITLQQDKDIAQELDEHLERFFSLRAIKKLEAIRKKTGDAEASVTISAKEAKEFVSISERTNKIAHKLPKTALLYKSALILLVSHFDLLISDLLHNYYNRFPASLEAKEGKLDYATLMHCSTIDEAREILVWKEVERLLYTGLKGQLAHFETAMNVNCCKDLVDWDSIGEAIERRNLIVHSDSKVNERYLRFLKNTPNVTDKEPPKKGEQIKVGVRYFRKVLSEFRTAGMILIYSCWTQWTPRAEDKREISVNENNRIFDLLREGENKSAEQLSTFALRNVDTTNLMGLTLFINYCQSLKWQGRSEEMTKALRNKDDSTLGPLYRMAIAALKDDRDKFYRHLRNAIVLGDISREDLEEWPLFREIRQDKDFNRRVGAAFAHAKKSSQRTAE